MTRWSMQDSFTLNEILKLDNTSLIDFIDKRIEIIKAMYQTNRDIGYKSLFSKALPYYGFVSNHVKIRYDLDNNIYRIIKNDYLLAFFQYVKNNNLTTKDEAILEIPAFLNEYFGPKLSRVSTINDAFDIDNSPKITLKDINSLRYKNVAGSLEYSLIAQNILAFLGYNVIHVVGCYKSKTFKEFYGSNLIIIDNNYYLFDFYEPINVYNKTGDLIGIHPYQIKLKNNENKLYFKGLKVIKRRNYRRLKNNSFYEQKEIGEYRYYSLNDYFL